MRNVHFFICDNKFIIVSSENAIDKPDDTNPKINSKNWKNIVSPVFVCIKDWFFMCTKRCHNKYLRLSVLG